MGRDIYKNEKYIFKTPSIVLNASSILRYLMIWTNFISDP